MTAPSITVDQLEDGHTLILGTTGSGKTYQLRGLLEQLRRAGRRVGAIDKLGNHWGLTLAADGSGPGLDFVIFGGKRAHVPMAPGDGDKLARLFVERNIPAIFDLSQWAADEQEQWIAAFAQTVFRVNEEALHLSIDEAQSFVPTGGGGDAYRAVRLLAEQGRGNGIRLLLACQRLARLDSTVRGMMHTAVAMRQTSPIDRKAVKDLISADAEQAALIESELPKLPVGTGYVWSAGDVALRRIKFAANVTFDSSRTPKHGDTPPAPIAVSSALVDELRAALAPAAEPEPYPDDTIPTEPAAAYAKGGEVGAMLRERDEEIADLRAANELLTATANNVVAERDRLQASFDRVIALVRQAYDPLRTIVAADLPTPTPTQVEAITAAAKTPSGATIKVGSPPPAVDGKLGAERRPLAVLAGFAPAGLTDASWATLAGFKRTGGTWTTYRSRLRIAGLIEQDGDKWRATDAGGAAIGGYIERPPAPGLELVAFWADRIPGAKRMLIRLGQLYPKALKRDALAADLGMAPAGGTFGTYLSRLRGNGLLEEKQGRIRLAPALMGDAL